MVPQRGHDEVGALERCYAGRDRAGLFVERSMREGKVSAVPREARRERKKSRDHVLVPGCVVAPDVKELCLRSWRIRDCCRESFVLAGGGTSSSGETGNIEVSSSVVNSRNSLVVKASLERATLSDDGYVANGGMTEDIEDRGGDVVLSEDTRRREQHPIDVERDVALADDGHMVRFV